MSNNPDISFVAEQRVPVKDLKGISKNAASTAAKGGISRKYLSDLAQAELDADLDATFAKLKSAFRFKRKELTADGPADGMGVITTPHFFYEVTVVPVEDAPRNVIIRRCVRNITDADVITGADFFEVFGSRFNQLEVACDNPLDLEAIIDQIEDAEADDVDLDYDKDVTHCTIGLMSMRTTILVRPNSIHVKGPADVTPADLVHSFFEMQNCFMESLNLSEPLLKSSS